MFGLGLVPSVSVGSSANMAIVKVFVFCFLVFHQATRMSCDFYLFVHKHKIPVENYHHSETLSKLRKRCEIFSFIYFYFFFHSLTCQSTPASSTDTLPELRAVPVGLAESYGVAARLTWGVGSGLPAEDAAAPISSSPANSRACGLEDNSFQPCVVS